MDSGTIAIESILMDARCGDASRAILYGQALPAATALAVTLFAQGVSAAR